ncbi:MAG TPA: cytochrome c biogenesis protein ResB [Prolixibacteraceae bacterium]|nr:cytochrome c biogenesis protein ResB [Prolixibacteraceae bacterium]
MNNERISNIGKKPWSYRVGTIITGAIILLGFVFQAASGGMELQMVGFPWNLISGIVFLALLILIYLLWQKHPVIKELGSIKAALPAIIGFTFLVLLMGFVKQDVSAQNEMVKLLGLNHLVKTWPFILINLYLMILLGIIILKRLTPFNLKNAGFFLNHFGLFLVLFSTSLGSSDMQRLTMNCYENQTENLAADESGRVVELPFSIQLLNFSIDEFRPKVILVNNKTGQIVQNKGKVQFELLDRDSFDLSSYQIKVEQFLVSSGKIGEAYRAVNDPGSAPSAKLKVTGSADQSEISGWVCSGSYNMRPEALKINDNCSLVMLPAEPRKFSSELNIQSQSGKNIKTTIEVNKPFHFDGWAIYQLSYNTEMGRWSDLSVLELVRDPWLPVVYLGIFLMMAGAGFLFIYGKPKNGGTDYVA